MGRSRPAQYSRWEPCRWLTAGDAGLTGTAAWCARTLAFAACLLRSRRLSKALPPTAPCRRAAGGACCMSSGCCAAAGRSSCCGLLAAVSITRRAATSCERQLCNARRQPSLSTRVWPRSCSATTTGQLRHRRLRRCRLHRAGCRAVPGRRGSPHGAQRRPAAAPAGCRGAGQPRGAAQQAAHHRCSPGHVQAKGHQHAGAAGSDGGAAKRRLRLCLLAGSEAATLAMPQAECAAAASLRLSCSLASRPDLNDHSLHVATFSADRGTRSVGAAAAQERWGRENGGSAEEGWGTQWLGVKGWRQRRVGLSSGCGAGQVQLLLQSTHGSSSSKTAPGWGRQQGAPPPAAQRCSSLRLCTQPSISRPSAGPCRWTNSPAAAAAAAAAQSRRLAQSM